MVTALDAREVIVQALEQGANDYVVKPVEMPVIVARIEAQIQRSKTGRLKARQLTPEAQEGAWDWDPASRTAHFSERWKEILGHSPQEVGDDLAEWLDRIHPHDLLRVRKHLNAHIEGHDPEFRCEHRLRHKASWCVLPDRLPILKTARDPILSLVSPIAASFWIAWPLCCSPQSRTQRHRLRCWRSISMDSAPSMTLPDIRPAIAY
jgi:PAS domain-containing protein